jgi:SWI/SNF-related matrix-associated actin-dependent regulator of chromatin subfamily A-like protein 1
MTANTQVRQAPVQAFDDGLPELNVHLDLKMKLYPYQGRGVAYALQKQRLILGDDMGCGKSAQAIATIVGSNTLEQGPCLVICPNSIKLNWVKEWSMWTDYKAVVLNDANIKTWHYYYHSRMAHVFVINYESLRKYFVLKINKPEKGKKPLLKDYVFTERIDLFKSVIIDESHRVKDTTTQQTKIVKRICSGKDWVLALTGTPVINKPEDLLAPLAILDRLKDIGGKTYFTSTFCQGYKKASNLALLNELLKQHCFYRRLKTDVLHDLPDKFRQVINIDLSAEQKNEYAKAELDLITYLKQYKEASDEQIKRSLRGEMMVRIGILKNITARGKLSDIKDYITDIINSGQKLIVFVHLREVAAQLKVWFPKAMTILGGDSIESRQQAIDRFQTDIDAQLIICSIKAAGVGVTLTAASRVAFVELPWTAADTDQCEDRAYRLGQKNSVQCIYFLGKGTIDHYIYKIIQEKRDIARQVTGDNQEIKEDMFDDLINYLTK